MNRAARPSTPIAAEDPDEPSASGHGSAEALGTRRGAEGRRHGRARVVSVPPRPLIFAVSAAVPAYLALEGGGYDLVARQEAGAVLWSGLALGFLFRRLPCSTMAWEGRVALWSFGMLVAWIALSALWSDSVERTGDEFVRALNYAGLLLLAFSALDRRSWRVAAAGLAVGAVTITAVSLLSRLAPDLFPNEDVTGLFGGMRLAYPLDYWNAVASWAAVSLVLGVAWSIQGRYRVARALALATVPVSGLVAYLSYSRAGIAVAVVGVGVVIWLSENRRLVLIHVGMGALGVGLAVLVARTQPEINDGTGSAGAALVFVATALAAVACGFVAARTRRLPRAGVTRSTGSSGRRLIAIGAAALLALAVTLGPYVVSSAGQQFASPVDEIDPGDPATRLVSLGGGRHEVWGSALDAFASSPLHGTGAGTFEFFRNANTDDGQLVVDAHSLYLETLGELGIPGLALVLGGILVLIVGASRARRATRSSTDAAVASGLVAAALVYALHAGVDWMWESTAVTVLGLGAGAIAVAGMSEPRSRPSSRRERSPIWLGLVCVLAVGAQVPGLVMTSRARDAQSLAAAFETEAAAEAAADAVDAAPWAATPYAVKALVDAGGGHPHLALADAREAIEREPTNFRQREILADIMRSLGRTEEAEREERAAARLAPPGYVGEGG